MRSVGVVRKGRMLPCMFSNTVLSDSGVIFDRSTVSQQSVNSDFWDLNDKRSVLGCISGSRQNKADASLGGPIASRKAMAFSFELSPLRDLYIMQL